MASSHQLNQIPSRGLTSGNDPRKGTPLSALKDTSPALWYRLHVLVFDLEHFDTRSDAKARLELITDKLYLGPPYFTPEEAETIRSTDYNGEPFSEVLQKELSLRLSRRENKRVQSGDFRVCAAHDLSPILRKALGIDIKRLTKDRMFLRLVDNQGLEFGEKKWDGLERKSYAPRKRKGKR